MASAVSMASVLPGSAGAASLSVDQAIYALKIKEASGEFEKLLIRQMLREIRSGSLVSSSSESRGYMDIADDQLVDVFQGSGGLGFGTAMAQQFLQQIGVAKAISR